MEEKCKNPETKIKNILPDGVKLKDYSDILRRLKQIKKKKERDSKSQSFFLLKRM
jgi:Xaa-Pro aminopeptidase